MNSYIKRISCTLLLALLYTTSIKAQSNGYAEVGKPLANFTLTDVEHYTRRKVSGNEFMAQWLVLDFWNRYCSTCLKKMPHLDSLRQEFAGKVNFFLVGYTGSLYTKRSDDKEIRALYKRYAKDEKLGLAIAYDSVLFHRLDIGACPFIVVIDPQGIVRAVTSSIGREQLNDLLLGKAIEYRPVYRREEYKKMLEQKKQNSQ